MNRHACNILFAIIVILIAASCGEGRKNTGSFKPVHLSFKEPPAMMEGQDRLQFVAGHFWDDLFKEYRSGMPCDTSLVAGTHKTEIEQAIANYILLLESMPLDEASGHISKLTEKAVELEKRDTCSNVFETLTGLLEKYLYDTNSPFRDEDLYTALASKLSKTDIVEPAKRAVYAEDVLSTSKNPRGSKAADFSFCDSSGRRYSLHKIKAQRIILFFSNPGCNACKEIIDAIQAIKDIDTMISSGKIAVLNIYIDQDLGEWKKYMPIYPDNWYNCFDPDYVIRGDELYNIRAIPSLYLLDEDKHVILKDTTTERLINSLNL